MRALALCALALACLVTPTRAVQCGRESGGALCRDNLCCSKWGFCGLSEAYCGDGCQSGACYPSQRCGKQGGGATCPGDLCCSANGYCGLGFGFCAEGCQGGACLPLVRIICKENDKVSVAVRNNTVVFVTTNSGDKSQLWVQDYNSVGKLAADDGCRKPFALVTVGTGLAMIPAENKWDPMELAQYNPDECVPLSMLWTKGKPVRDNFYMIKLFQNESKAFNGLGRNVREGTILGWGGTGPEIGDNILFKIVDTTPKKIQVE